MRSLVLVGTAILGLVAANTAGSQGNSSGPLNVHRVAGNVYALDNGTSGFNGSNIAVLVGSQGLLLVDAQGWGDPQPVLAALQSISDKPVRYVVDTHCHSDHSAGNAAFQAAGATIVAHENVRKRLAAKKCDEEVALPTLTVASELTLHFDEEEVQVIALPTGHTDGDALVYFKNANVLATGDAFISAEIPFYSKYAGGNMLGVNEALRSIVERFPDDVKIITGHGPPSSMSDVRRALEVLDNIRDAIAQQVAAGKSLDQLMAMNLLEPWKDLLGEQGPMFLTMYYQCLAGPPDPAFQL